MFCRRCYAELPSSLVGGTCPACGANYAERSSLRRPFPPVGNIVATLVGTTLVGLVAAAVVAIFQSAPFDGH